MKDLFEMCGECRHLSDAEVVYQITNSEKTSKEVEKMLLQSDKVTIDEICEMLTPARREMAKAVIELYKRLQAKQTNFVQIKCSNDIYNVVKPYLSDMQHEECWAIYLNQASRVIRKQRISTGGLASTQVDVRVVLREALKNNATSMILVHNHPTGDPTPSQKDIDFTKRLEECSKLLKIDFLDHIVIGKDKYTSIKRYLEKGNANYES